MMRVQEARVKDFLRYNNLYFRDRYLQKEIDLWAKTVQLDYKLPNPFTIPFRKIEIIFINILYRNQVDHQYEIYQQQDKAK